MIPSQNASGINGASVVSVPESTGRKTSPAASFAAFIIPIPWFSKKIRCVFSITTIASSTTIPSASRNAKSTIMFIDHPMALRTMKATAIDNGTDNATKNELVAPIKT